MSALHVIDDFSSSQKKILSPQRHNLMILPWIQRVPFSRTFGVTTISLSFSSLFHPKAQAASALNKQNYDKHQIIMPKYENKTFDSAKYADELRPLDNQT
jgi:hypothetical protein